MDYTYNNLFHYFKKFLLPYKGRFVFGSFLRLISAVIGLYNAYAVAFLVTFLSQYSLGDNLYPLYFTILTWWAAFIIRNILIYYAKKTCIILGEKASLDIEKDTLKYLSMIDIAWHEKENAGNKVKRIQKGADGVSTMIRVWIVNIIDISVNFIGTFYIISLFDFKLGVLIVVYQIIYYTVSTIFRNRTAIASRNKNIKEEEASGFMYEIMNNIRSVKVLGMADPLLKYVQKINNDLVELIKKNLFWYHAGILARTSWQSTGRVILMIIVVYGIIKGEYEVGFFVLFYGYFNTVSTSIEDLSSVTQEIVLAKTNVGRLAELYEQPIVIENDHNKISFPTSWDSIKISNLSFGYGENIVLSNISFDIKKGEKIGLVGLSGAGKSTLFKLLLKEYESSKDSIFIGDVPLGQIRKSDYVNHVAAVLQDTEVFNLSLKDNIIISNSLNSNNNELLEKALNVSHVNDFINKLPEGVNTLIGEKGIKLSGGEKQRLGIARAVFKNPEIFFLDEATSHLDVESEQKIQDSLKHFFKDVTAVVIAHRLSTIKEMDKIIVLENGKIIETGTFDELYKLDKRFREFWDKQKL